MESRSAPKGDRVLCDLFYRFPPDVDVPQNLKAAAHESSFDTNAGHWLSLGSLEVDGASSVVRQERLEIALDDLISRASATGFDIHQLQALGGWLRLDLVLVPKRGQAGIVIGYDQIARLNRLGAQIAVKSWAAAR